MGAVDPVRDREVIEFELALSDLGGVEKRLDKMRRASRTGDKEALAELPALERAYEFLKEGRGLWEAKLTPDELAALAPLSLLTSKPVLYAANVSDSELHGDEGPHLKALRDAVKASGEHAEVVPFSAKIEAELAELPEEEAAELLAAVGQEEPGLHQLARVGFATLGLQTYLTAGPKEARAWTIRKGATAPEAAGVIHTDFQRGFIKAEIVSFDQLVQAGSMAEAKSRGWVRIEGKDYVMQDGDVVEFRFNV
jgi:GTP-binding protein YchF